MAALHFQSGTRDYDMIPRQWTVETRSWIGKAYRCRCRETKCQELDAISGCLLAVPRSLWRLFILLFCTLKKRRSIVLEVVFAREETLFWDTELLFSAVLRRSCKHERILHDIVLLQSRLVSSVQHELKLGLLSLFINKPCSFVVRFRAYTFHCQVHK